jgi:lipid A ethanolaminephosphotransferase
MASQSAIKQHILFHLGLNTLVVIFITGASYYHLPLSGFKDTLTYLIHLIILQSSVAGILYFLSFNLWVFRLVFSSLFFLFSAFAFWAYTQDISVTPHLIQAAFESKPDIAIDVISGPFLSYLSLSTVMIYLMNRWRKAIGKPPRPLLFGLLAAASLSLYPLTERFRPGTLQNRLPYNVVYSISEYQKRPSLTLSQFIPDLKHHQDSLVMILVLGESVRADHLGINGYVRNTTPELSQIPGIISFKKLYTEHTYTAASLPQILTDQGQVLKDTTYTSVYSILNRADFQTLWLGNQTLERGYAPLVATNDSVVLIDAFKNVFSFNKRKDEDLLPPLKAILPDASRSVISLHMIGSHWWYEDRYKDIHRRFTPVIDSKYIPSLSPEQLINSYDNTILYLDEFLSLLINELKQHNTPSVLVYISDHGEQLGENGKWLHAQAGEAAKNPAYLIWFSQDYKNRYPEIEKYIQDSALEKATTDRVFYDLLRLNGIKFENY